MPPTGQPARAVLSVRVTARAKEDDIVGWRGDTLIVRLKAPPVEGKANTALRKLLAAALGVRATEIEITGGAGSRLSG